MRSFLRTHPIGSGLGGLAILAALAWLAFGFFGVHTLFIVDVVDEAGPVFDADPVAAQTTADDPTPPTVDEPDGPVASEPTGDATTPSTAPTPSATTPPVTTPAVTTPPTASTVPEIVTEFTGTFVDKAHPTDGSAAVLGNGSGQRFVRFENFETDNGPDLNVYLVNSSTGDVSDSIDLGDLKGNIGDQNYEIPADVDLSVYDTVVIWCVRFSVSFGEATLVAA
jgi:hypothetical protein